MVGPDILLQTTYPSYFRYRNFRIVDRCLTFKDLHEISLVMAGHLSKMNVDPLSVLSASPVSYIEAIALVTILIFLLNELYRWFIRVKGIPGPRGIPIVGNLHQIGKKVIPPEQYRLWSLKYGPVFQIQLGNKPILVINSAAAAKDLLIKESGSLNSRPLFYVFHKFVSKEIASIGTSPWDESCKKRRKAAASALNVIQVDSYAPVRCISCYLMTHQKQLTD